MLEFKVEKQKLIRLDVVEPATDSEQYLKAKFTIKDSDWNEKVKTALFRLDEVVYKALLDSNNECVVPSEVLVRKESKYARTQGSKIFVSLIGEYSTTRITTDEVCVVLNASGYSDALTPAKPTESEYQQILTQYANNEAAINQAKAECETARADLVGVKNIFANAINGNLSGAVVFADDVSPVEHNPVVKVHGKNLIPSTVYNMANWDLASGTSNNYVFPLDLLKDGSKYTVSAEILDNSIGYFYVEESANGFLTDTNHQIHMPNTSNMPYTFEKKKGHEYRLFWFDSSGHTLNDFATNIQLEEGDTATEYEAWVDPSTMTVKRCGKQVFAGKEYELAKEYAWSSILIAKIFCGSGNYVASCNFKQKGDITRVALSVRDYDETTDTLKHVDTTDASGVLTAPFVVEEGKKGFQVFLYSNYSADDLSTNCLFENIQVEVGTEATPYQPYNATTHTPSADGTVEGITSLSPNMTILTDTEGAIVECEYIKDTNKVVQKLADALGITI